MIPCEDQGLRSSQLPLPCPLAAMSLQKIIFRLSNNTYYTQTGNRNETIDYAMLKKSLIHVSVTQTINENVTGASLSVAIFSFFVTQLTIHMMHISLISKRRKMKESTVQHFRNGGVAHLSMILISTKTLHTWTDVATATGNNCIKKRFFPQKDRNIL